MQKAGMTFEGLARQKYKSIKRLQFFNVPGPYGNMLYSQD